MSAKPTATFEHAMRREGLGEASRLVWDFLTLFAERRYGEANAFLAPGARILFPGGIEFTDCTAIPAASAGSYRWVKKAFERFDEAPAADGTVVYCYGTLYGEWPDGEAFAGVRYIDRFLIRSGQVIDQKVWNDLAAARAKRAAP